MILHPMKMVVPLCAACCALAAGFALSSDGVRGLERASEATLASTRGLNPGTAKEGTRSCSCINATDENGDVIVCDCGGDTVRECVVCVPEPTATNIGGLGTGNQVKVGSTDCAVGGASVKKIGLCIVTGCEGPFRTVPGGCVGQFDNYVDQP